MNVNETTSPFPGQTVAGELGPDDRELLLETIAESYLARLQAGEAPDRAALLSEHAHLSEALERRLALMDLLHRMAAARTVVVAPVVSLPDNVTSSSPADGLMPRHVGDYEVLGELGRGGMGVVYKARHLALNRLVALKMILAGASARLEERIRFKVEAQTLASLQHPNIVQVYEVGEHNGLPYLALELVEGGSLDSMILARQQPARASAALVETLARAMHVAHQRGIIHRDLKPANVLLRRKSELSNPLSEPGQSGQGSGLPSDAGLRIADLMEELEPKVTDFGLAKRLMEDQEGPTRTTGIVGTPSYMAPEQADGPSNPVTPATDVWALGTILYEMLTGQAPFRGESSYATIRLVQSQEPVAPGKLRPGLARDLETICCKCLQKDPTRRYPTALDLADDLHRFLSRQPIHARPVATWERAWMWSRRRPALAGLLLVSTLALLGFLGGGLWYNFRLRAERDRADRNLEAAVSAVETMLHTVGAEKLENEPHMELKRRKLIEESLAYFQRFLQDNAGNPRLRRALALAEKSQGDALRYLGRYGEAQAAYHEAIPLLEQAQHEAPDDGRLAEAQADAWNWLGESLREDNKPQQADHAYKRSLALWAARPAEPRAIEEQARVRYNWAIALRAADRPDQAREQLGLAIGLLQSLSDPGPRARQHLARWHINHGQALRDANAFAEAEDHYRRAVVLLDGLLREGQSSPELPFPEYQHERAVVSNNLGNLLMIRLRQQGKDDLAVSAQAAHEDARDRLRPLVKDFPHRRIFRQELASAYNGLGNVHASRGDLDRAETDWKEAAQLLRQLVAEDDGSISYWGDLGLIQGNLGYCRAGRKQPSDKDWEQARDSYRDAVISLHNCLAINPMHPDYRRALRDQYRSLAEASLNVRDHAGAYDAALRLASVFSNDPLDSYHAACFTARCLKLSATEKKYRQAALGLLERAAANGFRRQPRLFLDDQARYFQPLAQDDDYRTQRERIVSRSP